MKKHTRMIALAVALIAVLLVATGSAAAGATRTDFSYTLFICSMDAPEKEWMSGKPPDGPVYHWRGQPSLGRFVSTELEWWHGVVPGVSDGDIKLGSLSGNMRGPFEKQFANEFVTGTFAGRIVGKYDAGVWSIWGGGRGGGDLEGVQYFADGVELPAVPSSDPCPGGALTAYAMNGVLIDTRGD